MSFLLLFVVSVAAAGYRVLLTEADPPLIGLLNITTGKLVTSPVKFPPAPGCSGWNLGGNGTRGQTSTVFYENQTWFVIAAGTNCTVPPPISVFSIMGPFSPGDTARVRALAPLTTTSPLLEMNVAWDQTCNVVVISRETAAAQYIFKTNQVSDYDGQQRVQVDYKTEPTQCTGCWRKVAGLGAIDPSPASASQNELNCGDNCVFYTLEENIDNEGKVVLPKKLVGRAFRTGALKVNISDTLQIQTMTFSNSQRMFFGVGRCCSETWCDPACKDLADQELVVFQYDPKKQQFALKARIGPEKGSDPNITVRLGPEFDDLWQPTKLRVLYDGNIVSFDLKSWVRTDIPLQFSEFVGLWSMGWSG